MNKQESLFVSVSLFICFLLLLSGCTNQIKKTESIADILLKAETVNSVYYDINVTYTSTDFIIPLQNASASMKVWDKYPYQKTEFTINYKTTIIIIRPDGEYKYHPDLSKYIKINNETGQIKSCKELSRLLRNITRLKVIGTETIDGRETTIVEYNISYLIYPKTITYWIWNEKGIPLKEVETVDIAAGEMGNITSTTTMFYKNFSFENIPDSVFDVTQ